MSQANVETVQALFEAWNRNDLRSVSALVSEDLEWREVGGRPEGAEAGRMGREAIWEALESLLETFEFYRIEPESMRVLGDRVIAVVREVARGRTSGADVQSRWGYIFTFETGKLLRVEAYRDPDQALAAAGLPAGRA
jgi:ketosteroid isomerase-like protein